LFWSLDFWWHGFWVQGLVQTHYHSSHAPLNVYVLVLSQQIHGCLSFLFNRKSDFTLHVVSPLTCF
jgi:hypothetical protein